MKLEQYLSLHFPGLRLEPPLFYNAPNALRFEIGDPNKKAPNDEYFTGVYERAINLFEEIFKSNDELFVIEDYSEPIKIDSFVSTNSGIRVLPGFIKNVSFTSTITTTELEKVYNDKKELDTTVYRSYFSGKRDDIDYKRILQAISNSDFKCHPYTGSTIYFINTNKALLYNLYDDRGLDIVAEKTEILKPLYEKYTTWLLEYDRNIMDNIFMNPYEQKLKKFLAAHDIQAEHLTFQQSCHSVAEAAAAVNAKPDEFVKNICLMDSTGRLIVATVKGEDKVDISEVAKVLEIQKPRTATVEEILERTGYPCGGVPSFGYEAIFLVDPRVMEKEVVYSGGGSENSLLKITPTQLIKASQGQIIKVIKTMSPK